LDRTFKDILTVDASFTEHWMEIRFSIFVLEAGEFDVIAVYLKVRQLVASKATE